MMCMSYNDNLCACYPFDISAMHHSAENAIPNNLLNTAGCCKDISWCAQYGRIAGAYWILTEILACVWGNLTLADTRFFTQFLKFCIS